MKNLPAQEVRGLCRRSVWTPSCFTAESLAKETLANLKNAGRYWPPSARIEKVISSSSGRTCPRPVIDREVPADMAGNRRSSMALERELGIYQSNLIDLLADEGRFILICGEEIVGPFDTYEQTLEAGYQRFGLVPFLVKRIHKAEPIQYFSREIPR